MSSVIKLAQPGFDVKTTGDENLIYNSNWPLLKIYKQGSITYSTAQDTTLVTHDLGFVPVFWYFSNSRISGWNNFGAQSYENRSEFFGPIGDGAIKITDKSLRYDAVAFPGTSGDLRLYYYIFALDLTKRYVAPSFKVSDVTSGRSKELVFKLAKKTKDIHSTNLQDYVIHSRARSPLVHSVNPSPGAIRTFEVEHNFGYIPMFFGYQKNSDGSYQLLASGSGGSTNFQASDTKISFVSTGNTELTIVILKDPFISDYEVTVNV